MPLTAYSQISAAFADFHCTPYGFDSPLFSQASKSHRKLHLCIFRAPATTIFTFRFNSSCPFPSFCIAQVCALQPLRGQLCNRAPRRRALTSPTLHRTALQLGSIRHIVSFCASAFCRNSPFSRPISRSTAFLSAASDTHAPPVRIQALNAIALSMPYQRLISRIYGTSQTLRNVVSFVSWTLLSV